MDYYQRKIVHFIPQYLYICNEYDKIIIDKVIKFENLKEELVSMDKIFLNLNHINKSPENSFIILNESEKDTIYNFYRKDFEIFGYEK